MLFFFHRNRSPKAPRPRNGEPVASPPVDDRIRSTTTPYFLPKDAQEDERLFLQHNALYAALSNHYLAPIPPDIQNALDLGTGTGVWMRDMSTLFPQTHFVGMDSTASSFRYPSTAHLTFLIGDLLKGLPFPDQQFDFVHQRLLIAGIPTVNWPDVLREAVRVTRPGGWVELLEVGTTVKNAGRETTRLLKWMAHLSKERGFDLSLASHLGDLLTQAGLQAVEVQHIPAPLGAWAGHVGIMLKTDVVRAFEAVKGVYCAQAQIWPEQFDAWVEKAGEEWEQRHASYVFHIAYGKRVVP